MCASQISHARPAPPVDPPRSDALPRTDDPPRADDPPPRTDDPPPRTDDPPPCPDTEATRSGPPTLSPGERRALLRCARAALAAATGAGTTVELDDAIEYAIESAIGVDARAAAFVTLTEDGELRGCMGSLDPEQSIIESVVTAAMSAAERDPRFRRVAAAELDQIHVEVSVLGPRTPLVDPGTFRPGVDGVVVERDWRAALLLPEVATELGWSADQMFEAVCQKAGLPRDAWKTAAPSGRTRLYSFRTVRFGGPALAPAPDPAS